MDITDIKRMADRIASHHEGEGWESYISAADGTHLAYCKGDKDGSMEIEAPDPMTGKTLSWAPLGGTGAV